MWRVVLRRFGGIGTLYECHINHLVKLLLALQTPLLLDLLILTRLATFPRLLPLNSQFRVAGVKTLSLLGVERARCLQQGAALRLQDRPALENL